MLMRAWAAGLAGAGAVALALGGCGAGHPARAPSRAVAAAPVLSSARGSCRAVAARTLRTIAARIEARAAADRRGTRGSPPTLVARLTAAPVRACAPSPPQTVAETIGAVGGRLRRGRAPRPQGPA